MFLLWLFQNGVAAITVRQGSTLLELYQLRAVGVRLPLQN